MASGRERKTPVGKARGTGAPITQPLVVEITNNEGNPVRCYMSEHCVVGLMVHTLLEVGTVIVGQVRALGTVRGPLGGTTVVIEEYGNGAKYAMNWRVGSLDIVEYKTVLVDSSMTPEWVELGYGPRQLTKVVARPLTNAAHKPIKRMYTPDQDTLAVLLSNRPKS